MGKSKKTRWRTFSFDGSKDETSQINGAVDVKLNGTASQINNSQKYSQILGDHHTNNSSQLSNKSTSSSSSLVHYNNNNSNNFKARNYNNNKENYYNQRSVAKNTAAVAAFKSSWQQRNNRTSATNLRVDVRKLENENDNNNNKESSDVKSDSTKAEPIKFNEDEYTRITTPRQDVLFKKGYLSRMNNKTANNTSSTINNSTATSPSVGDSTTSTAPNSTIATNSDPESSVSTLSPATTPSQLEYGQVDPIEFAPVYYSGYYDENGMFVFPMYNGYNYYHPQTNGSATSPVYFMPYPYQYDPFFMAPNTEVPSTTENNNNNNEDDDQQQQQNGDDENGNEQKINESNGAKESNQFALEQNGASSSSAEDATSNSSKHSSDEKLKSEEQKEMKQDEQNDDDDQTPKQSFPIYPNANDLGYVYPYYGNGFYNGGGFYYYNGMPTSQRPPKMKRRKRFLSSRSSHSHPRSAETTTDYSDDDNSINNKRFNNYQQSSTRYHNGYHHHHNNHHHNHHYHNKHYNNGYNQYHYNAKYHKIVDQNTNQAQQQQQQQQEEQRLQQHESILNVDVQEFYPRVQNDVKSDNTKICDVPVNDLEQKCDQQQQQQINLSKSKLIDTPKVNNNIVNNKASQQTSPAAIINTASVATIIKPPATRVSKKEIIEGIKSMEQQNINLLASSKIQATPVINNSDVEWNVIKKGKKVKVVKENVGDAVEIKNNNIDNNEIKNVDVEIKPKETQTISQEIINKKTLPSPTSLSGATITTATVSSSAIIKSKKSKSKNKKKKPHLMVKQDGFQIIEPEFGNTNNNNNNSNDKESEEITCDASEDDTIESEINLVNDSNDDVNFESTESVIKCEANEKTLDVVVDDNEIATTITPEICEVQEILKVINVTTALNANKKADDNNDAVIDISDEEICGKTSIEIDLSIAQEMIENDSKPVAIDDVIDDVKKDEVKQEVKKEEVKKTVEEQLFEDMSYFNDVKNIAELERDLMENLKILDDGIDIKSPIINPLFDFPITSAVQKWLQAKQNESFESLFRVENFKKLSELYDDCDDESDISDTPNKSDATDSDYASDVQVKLNGSPASSNAKIDTKHTSKCNNKVIVKESFCALM